MYHGRAVECISLPIPREFCISDPKCIRPAAPNVSHPFVRETLTRAHFCRRSRALPLSTPRLFPDLGGMLGLGKLSGGWCVRLLILRFFRGEGGKGEGGEAPGASKCWRRCGALWGFLGGIARRGEPTRARRFIDRAQNNLLTTDQTGLFRPYRNASEGVAHVL